MSILKRRDFMKIVGLGSAALASPDIFHRSGRPSNTNRPNVLFVALDDWIEPLGGHPQARTPNLKRFAEEAAEKSGKGPKFYPEPDPWTIQLFDY
jgi:hypothetical protein